MAYLKILIGKIVIDVSYIGSKNELIEELKRKKVLIQKISDTNFGMFEHFLFKVVYNDLMFVSTSAYSKPAALSLLDEAIKLLSDYDE
jgi:hypothetical protein